MFVLWSFKFSVFVTHKHHGVVKEKLYVCGWTDYRCENDLHIVFLSEKRAGRSLGKFVTCQIETLVISMPIYSLSLSPVHHSSPMDGG